MHVRGRDGKQVLSEAVVKGLQKKGVKKSWSLSAEAEKSAGLIRS